MISETSAPESDAAWRLDASDFDLFGLPAIFTLDRTAIDARWRSLMARVHPDRFAAAGAAQQCEAMQWAIRLNQAYERLKTPLSRAAYLCELHGKGVGAEAHTPVPTKLLVQVMDWREALVQARTADEIDALAGEAAGYRRSLLEELAVLIDTNHDWDAAAGSVRAMMFVTRFEEEVERRASAML